MQVRMAGDAGRVGQHQGRAGAEILVGVVERVDVVGCEVIDDLQAPAIGILVGRGGGRVGLDLDQGFVIVVVGGEAVGIEGRRAAARVAVAGFKVEGGLPIEGFVRIEGQAAAAAPDASLAAIGVGAQDPGKNHPLRRQVGDVPCDDPAMIRADVAVRSPFGVDHAVHQAQGGAVGLVQGVELDHAPDIAVARAVDVDRCVIGVIVCRVAR